MKDEEFLKIYEAVDNDGFPAIRGKYFPAEQYADLADLIFSRMITALEKGDQYLVNRYVEWSMNTLHCRREKRFYQDILHSHFISKSAPMMNDSGKRFPFHGGCISCNTHEKYGTKYCRGCQFFDADWSKPNLRNPVELLKCVLRKPEVEDNGKEDTKYRKVSVTSHQFYKRGWFHGYAVIGGATQTSIYALVEDEYGSLNKYHLDLYNLRFLEPIKNV